MDRTLAERIKDSVGNGRELTELTVLDTLDALTATAAEINALASATSANSTTGKAAILGTSGALIVAGAMTTTGVITPVVVVTDAASYTVLAANSGKVHVCPDFTQTTTMTLPAPVNGYRYRFIAGAVAADASNWVITAPAAAFLKGGVSFTDNDAGAGADEQHAGVYPNGSSHLSLTVVTPAAGTFVEVVSDGTYYYLSGWINSATVPTVA